MYGVIDLVDSDEDDLSFESDSPPAFAHSRLSGGMSDAMRRNLAAAMRTPAVIRPAPVIPTNPASVRGSRVVEVFDLISSDDEEPPYAPVVNNRRLSVTDHYEEISPEKTNRDIANANDDNPVKVKRQRVEVDKNDYYAIKREFEPVTFGKANFLDEVVEMLGEGEEKEELELSSSSSNMNKVNADTNNDECEIECLGGNMNFLSDMPHQREACSGFPFSPYDRSVNRKYCKQCFCYICDINAKDCLEWPEHCNASHRIPAYKEEQRARKIPALNILSSADKGKFFLDNKIFLFNELKRFDMATWQSSFTVTEVIQLIKHLVIKTNLILDQSDLLLTTDKKTRKSNLQNATVWLLLIGNFQGVSKNNRKIYDAIELLLLRILFHPECDRTIINHLKVNFQDQKRQINCLSLAKITDVLYDCGVLNISCKNNLQINNEYELNNLSDQVLVGIIQNLVRASNFDNGNQLMGFLNTLIDLNLTVFFYGVYFILENAFKLHENESDSETDISNENKNIDMKLDNKNKKININIIKRKKVIYDVTQLIRSISSTQWEKNVQNVPTKSIFVGELKSIKIISILLSILRKLPNKPSYNVILFLFKCLHIRSSVSRPYDQSLSNYTFLSNVIHLIKNRFGCDGFHPAEWVLKNYENNWTAEEEHAVAISLSVRMNYIIPSCYEKKYYSSFCNENKDEYNNIKENESKDFIQNKIDSNVQSKNDSKNIELKDLSPSIPPSLSSSSTISLPTEAIDVTTQILDSSTIFCKQWNSIQFHDKKEKEKEKINERENILKYQKNSNLDPCYQFKELYPLMDGPSLMLLIIELKDLYTYPSSSLIPVEYEIYKGCDKDINIEGENEIENVNDSKMYNYDECDKMSIDDYSMRNDKNNNINNSSINHSNDNDNNNNNNNNKNNDNDNEMIKQVISSPTPSISTSPHLHNSMSSHLPVTTESLEMDINDENINNENINGTTTSTTSACGTSSSSSSSFTSFTATTSPLYSAMKEECFYHAMTLACLYLPLKLNELDLSWDGQSVIPNYARGTY